jgi:erythromycin esterase
MHPALRPLPAICVLVAACDSPSESRPIPETPLEWVEQNAHVVRSISVTDRNYRDLEPLRDAIGGARVVMLGEMAGVDPVLTGSAGGDSIAAQVARFAREISSPVVNDPAWPSALATLREVGSGRGGVIKPPAQEQEALLRILATLRTHATAAGGRRTLFWRQVLESLGAWARMVWAQPEGGGTSPSIDIIREDQMSRNMLWLANEHYRGRKIIVWAHTAHVSRNQPALRSMSGVQQGTPGLRRMGEQVHAVLGDDMYALGFTAARGSWARGRTPEPLQAPLEGSLEAHLDQLGMAYAFIDFRDPGPGGEWLRDAVARPFNYTFLRGDWPRVLDGMFYTREMTPSTWIPR